MDCLVELSAAPSRWNLLVAAAATMRRWSGPVALSVADQGLASGAHFAVSLLLARWLAPGDYGAFALAYAVFLLAGGLDTALILEPMGVIGPNRYAASLPLYLSALFWLHGGLTLAIAVVLLVVAAAMAVAGSGLAPALAAMGLAAPGILVFWLFRRACYLSARPDVAVKAGLAYAAALAASLSCLWRWQLVGAGGVFLLMAACGVLVSLPLWRRLGVRGRDLVGWTSVLSLREVARHHWAYARWSVGTTAVYWLAGSIYLPVVGALAGLQAVAAYRAADNLLLPMSQVLTALGLLLLPWLSGQHRVRGRGYLRATAVRMALLAACAAMVYSLGISLFGARLLRLVYGGERYAGSVALLPLLGTAVVLRAIGDTGFGIAVRAAGRPDIGFWATAAAAAVTLTAGFVLVSRYGAQGAAAGWMASSAASCLVYASVFFRRFT
jgi:O-antigen/teichoic acid export membrane protein